MEKLSVKAESEAEQKVIDSNEILKHYVDQCLFKNNNKNKAGLQKQLDEIEQKINDKFNVPGRVQYDDPT